MEFLERVLDEKATELTRLLTDVAGFTNAEAGRFLSEAGPALIESYEWQCSGRIPLELDSEHAVRDLLGGIWGRTLAKRLGFSQAKTWEGLRAFVPAVVDASADRRPTHVAGGRGNRFGRMPVQESSFLELRFGLTLERPERRPGAPGGNGHRHRSVGPRS